MFADDVVSVPSLFSQALLQCRKEEQLLELYCHLLCLPESSERSARCAWVLERLQRREEALALLDQHPECRICMALKTRILLGVEGGDEAAEVLIEQADSWGAPQRLSDLEARANMDYARAIMLMDRSNFDLSKRYLQFAMD